MSLSQLMDPREKSHCTNGLNCFYHYCSTLIVGKLFFGWFLLVVIGTFLSTASLNGHCHENGFENRNPRVVGVDEVESTPLYSWMLLQGSTGGRQCGSDGSHLDNLK